MISEEGLARIFSHVEGHKSLEEACLAVNYSYEAILRLLEQGKIEQETIHSGGKPTKANEAALKAWVGWCQARNALWVPPRAPRNSDD